MLNQTEPVPLHKRLLKALFVLAFIALAGVFVLAFTVPGRWEIEESVRIEVPPERIFPLVSSVRTWELWGVWNQVDNPELEREFRGATEGVGSEVEWDMGRISGTTRIFSTAPPQQVSFSIGFDQRGAAAEGRIVLRHDGQGTDVFWRMWGDAGNDPWRKLAQWWYLDRLRHDMTKSLSRLRDKLESNYDEDGDLAPTARPGSSATSPRPSSSASSANPPARGASGTTANASSRPAAAPPPETRPGLDARGRPALRPIGAPAAPRPSTHEAPVQAPSSSRAVSAPAPAPAFRPAARPSPAPPSTPSPAQAPPPDNDEPERGFRRPSLRLHGNPLGTSPDDANTDQAATPVGDAPR